MNNLRQYFPNYLMTCLCLLIQACVSVQLNGGKTQKANDVAYRPPAPQFKVIESENADHAWQSQKTGNTLAYLSECQSNVDTTLKNLESDSLNALSQAKILKTETPVFNGRESSYSITEGLVDGVPVKLALLVFKKNGCNFTLSFVGRKSSFDKESTDFELFKDNFKVP